MNGNDQNERADGMNDPRGINTRAELREALQQLYDDCGLSYHQIFERSDVKRTATVHNLVKLKTFPRWETLQEVLQVWGITSQADLAQWKYARARAENDVTGLGVALDETEAIDPFALDVHRPISSNNLNNHLDLPVLPPYVRRAHDAELATVVTRAAAGSSAIAVLVAESSTGKTRALLEALGPLRAAGGWRLWHPLRPTRSQALDDLKHVRPRTLVWLNETQKYLTHKSAAEQVAVALHNLLLDTSRAPVLILGTLWREHHRDLCADPASAVSKLLEPAVIEVPKSFTGSALEEMRRAADTDPRIKLAIHGSEDGQITQYIAGGTELVRRFRFSSSAAARAIIEVAMDAVRMGHRNAVPYALLEHVAPFYMTNAERDQLDENWLEKALAETGEQCKGVRGPLTPIRPLRRPAGRRSAAHTSHHDLAIDAVPVFELADYLDQFSRTHRATVIPPVEFWDAAADYAHPDDLARLGQAAADRGMIRDAAQLWKNGLRHGDLTAAINLIYRFRMPGLAEVIATGVPVDNLADATALVQMMRETGATPQALQLACRAAEVADITRLPEVIVLIRELRHLDAEREARDLAHRAAETADATQLTAVVELACELRIMGASRDALELARCAAAEVDPAELSHVVALVRELRQTQATGEARELACRAAAVSDLSDISRVVVLAKHLRETGGADDALDIVRRAVTDVDPEAPFQMADLVRELRTMGARQEALDLARRIVAAADLRASPGRGEWAREAGVSQEALVMIRRSVTTVDVDNTSEVTGLVRVLRELGATQEAVELGRRGCEAAHSFHDNLAAPQLAYQLWVAGAHEEALDLARRAAADAELGNTVASTFYVNALVMLLRDMGAAQDAANLAHRAAPEVQIGTGRGMISMSILPSAPGEIGTGDELTDLVQLMPAARMFERFLEAGDHRERFQFGREPDGSPAAPWSWNDLR
ncbi:hypothetical protein [Nocardia xishanensis]|uniref:hypothetical protein n=1 Tax=Nocardia xishanensis TaxID=238964 RepID=UPI0012F4F059|nr:hypothetical protein [Nocardia xishanensis]